MTGARLHHQHHDTYQAQKALGEGFANEDIVSNARGGAANGRRSYTRHAVRIGNLRACVGVGCSIESMST